MPLPAGTTQIKIHPAIGFARLSDNRDHYVFGEPQHPQNSYKTNDHIRRQAVRFTIFAYDAAGRGLQELTPAWLAANGLAAAWRASVGNRKIAHIRHDESYVITAQARSDQNGGQLIGRCGDFADGQRIELGEIRPDGLFMPPIANVHSRVAGALLPPGPGPLYSPDFTDNTCDGIVSVELIDRTTQQPLAVTTLDAWVVVTPPDFAPDWDDPDEKNLEIFLEELLNLPNQAPSYPVNARAHAIDRAVLQRGTADFRPGIEISTPTEERFYPPQSVGDEIRVRPADGGGPGTRPGELSDGLCSPWQFDFLACTCRYWVNQRPDIAFRQAPTGPEVAWLRRVANEPGETPPGGVLDTNLALVRHVFELGIVRKDNDKRVEVERNHDIPPGTA